MASLIFKKYFYLRAVTAVFLILLIGFKIVAPVVFNFKAVYKVTAMTSQSAENDGEKKAENNPYAEKDCLIFSTEHNGHILPYTAIEHLTVYQDNYASSHYSTITIPPPDLYLQPTV